MQRREVDDELIKPVFPPHRRLASAIQHEKPILLAHKMVDREIRHAGPKNRLAKSRIDGNAAKPTQRWRDQVERSPFCKLVLIKIGSVERAVNMRNIDAEHQNDPQPRRRLLDLR